MLSYNLCTALPCVCESLIIAEEAGWRGNKHCLPGESPGSAASAVGSELAEPNAVSWWVLYPSTEQVHQKCRAQCTEASGGCSVHCMMAIFTLTTTRSEHSTTGSLPVHTSDCAGSLVNYTSAVHVFHGHSARYRECAALAPEEALRRSHGSSARAIGDPARLCHGSWGTPHMPLQRISY